jgi:hypothetical protein
MYNGFVVRVEHLRPHPNADKLQILTVFYNDTCVSLDVAIGDLGVYFPSDGQLSEEFCEYNHMCRTKKDGTPDTGYMDPEKRNVKAIRLRGEKSDGIYLPIKCLEYTGVDLDSLAPGDPIVTVNGHEICTKYIPKYVDKPVRERTGNRTRKKKEPTAPLFREHADTAQLVYNLGAFKEGDEIEITLKMHGTSQRTGYLPILQGYADTWPCRAGNAFRHIMRKMGCYHGEDVHDGEPIYDYGYVTGTRRKVLDGYDDGFYGSNAFREPHAKEFEGKLWKGETVFYEVVGFTTNGQPIMGDASNKKLNDKEFIKQYGEVTRFSYGCKPFEEREARGGKGKVPVLEHWPQSDIYVYRMTMTNPDGEVVEYTPDFMRYRCEQMGVKTVHVFFRGHITRAGIHGNGDFEYHVSDGIKMGACYGDGTIGDMIRMAAEDFYDGPDPIGKTHIREGVVVRIINRPKFTAYKHKNINFRILEGIYKEDATAPDMEEAQEVDNG